MTLLVLASSISMLPLSSSLSAHATITATGATTSPSPAKTRSILLQKQQPKPIVYTIAGSDSGGGAGLQADLHAMANMGCHGCSAVTCLTAQNSVGVTAVHTPPASFLQAQLEALRQDLPPVAVKIGMLPNRELAATVGAFLRELRTSRLHSTKQPPHVWVVLDPVMISTSGSRLMDEDAQQTLIDEVFPYVDVITPNKFEAEALLGGRTLDTARDVEQAARDLLQLGPVPAVLIKGGHTTADDADDGINSYARDYLLVRKQNEDDDDNDSSSEPRLCDGHRGVWLQSPRYDTIHTHGTGCTLSSSLAAALARGEASRQQGAGGGAWTSLDLVDASCLAKAYVSAGIAMAVPLGQGPGPVAQTVFPDSHEHYPSIITTTPDDNNDINRVPFRPLKAASGETKDDDRPSLGRILPIVDSVEWVERLCAFSKTAQESSSECSSTITDIQLRIKGETDTDRIREMVQKCQALCQAASVRLWINDYWEAAVEAGCFGVHVGQEDLYKMFEKGGLDVLRKHNMALGISTHSFGELAVALGVKPSYISLGPVFATGSKNVQFDPQGLEIVSKWRQLIPPDVPLVTIGGIGDATTASRVRQAGSDCVAVIGAVTSSQKAKDIATAVSSLNEAMA